MILTHKHNINSQALCVIEATLLALLKLCHDATQLANLLWITLTDPSELPVA